MEQMLPVQRKKWLHGLDHWCKPMNDEERISQLYQDMYTAMVNKDEAELDRVHDDSFVLIHMTGIYQGKREYIQFIMDGTLNYYSSEKESLDICLNGDNAKAVGRSRVTAAVFGGGKHTWRLELTFDLKKTEEGWKFHSSRASTY